MPTIQKPEKKKRYSDNKDTDMRKLRKQAYQNTTWRKLRDTYMKEHPICADCLAKGKITPAEDIHHAKSPFRNGEVNWGLLLDPDNLVSLCKQCHAERHNTERGIKTVQQILGDLDNLLYNNKDENMKQDE